MCWRPLLSVVESRCPRWLSLIFLIVSYFLSIMVLVLSNATFWVFPSFKLSYPVTWVASYFLFFVLTYFKLQILRFSLSPHTDVPESALESLGHIPFPDLTFC